MFGRNAVTLHIESSDVRYLVTRGERVLRWGSVPLAPNIVRQGAIADVAGLASAISALFVEQRLPLGGVVASLPGLRSTLRVISLPKVKRDLQREALRHESEREMPVALEDLYLRIQSLDTRGSEQRFVVIGVPRDIVDPEVRALELAGARPAAIHLKPLALARAVNRKDAVIIDLEPETFDLVVVADGIPAIMRTVMPSGESTVLEDRISQLTDEFFRTLAFHNSGHPNRPLTPDTPVFLTGLLADDTNARGLVEAAIRGGTETLAPSGGLPADLPRGQFAVNLGMTRRRPRLKRLPLADAGPLLDGINPNIAPPRHTPRVVSPAAMVFWSGAIALAALSGFMYQSYDSSTSGVSRLSTELVSVNRDIDATRDAVTAAAAAVRELEAEAESLKEAREAMLEALSSSNLEESLRSSLGLAPSEVRISSVNHTADHIDLGGTADSESTVADYLLALERTGLFSTVYISALSEVEGGARVSFDISGEVKQKA